MKIFDGGDGNVGTEMWGQECGKEAWGWEHVNGSYYVIHRTVGTGESISFI